MSKKKFERIYIVKFGSQGVPPTDMPFVKYSKTYNAFGIVDTGGNIDEAIERYRMQEQESMQRANPKITIVTKVVSVKKINVTQVLVSQVSKKVTT